MLYFDTKTIDGKTVVTNISDKSFPGAVSRCDFKTAEQAQAIAQAATDFSGDLYIASDRGANWSPRHEVVKAPKIGDAVSYYSNGDSYPDGTITHITKGTLRVIKTSTGSTYYRQGGRASWLKAGGTWSLIEGHHNKRNPSF